MYKYVVELVVLVNVLISLVDYYCVTVCSGNIRSFVSHVSVHPTSGRQMSLMWPYRRDRKDVPMSVNNKRLS